jgi:transposase
VKECRRGRRGARSPGDTSAGEAPARGERASGRASRDLGKGALRYGFSTNFWTIPHIVKVAEAEWGVSYSETAIWRMLKRQGLSGQRPRQQAREQAPHPRAELATALVASL